MDSLLFPYEKVRPVQADLMKAAQDALQQKQHLIVHAPTGLGKTAATLAPALRYALDNDKTVFFLTSKHTQHMIAIETLREIQRKHGVKFQVVDIIGKRWMCLQQNIEKLSSSDFADYCKKLREENQCEFYANTKHGLQPTVIAKKVMGEIQQSEPLHTEQMVEMARKDKVCPYYLAEFLAKKARVFVTDYYYVFHPSIRKKFFERIEKELEDCILIIDEGHNLPARVRDLLSVKLTSTMILRGIKEAKKFKIKELIASLQTLQEILMEYGDAVKRKERTGKERLVKKEDFLDELKKHLDIEQFIADCLFYGDSIKAQQKQSAIASIGKFLEAWQGEDQGFTRIFSLDEKYGILSLSYRCLDPSMLTKQVVEESHGTILMSGTLTPTFMYKDILGFPANTVEKELESPFDEENKLSLIVPETTTKFTMRNEQQFMEIAKTTAKMVNAIPGNSFLFFPSYALRDRIYQHFANLCEKHCILERQNLTKQEKAEMLRTFKAHKDPGAVLLGTVGGNFSESVDLPGDFLKGVIIVGLPLQRPDLETKELIRYFDEQYGKGWDYGYVFPAFTKCMQSAGRCIRTETDRGVIIFLDVRFAWPMYRRCFPQDSNMKITKLWERYIREFFEYA